MSSELKTNKISPATGTALQIGDSGDTITIPSGATLDTTGATVTGFGDNTPAFMARLSSAQTGISSDTWTKVTMDSEIYDTDSAYDHSTNYRFTVPSGEGGKYLIYVNMEQGNDNDSQNNMNENSGAIYVNGSIGSSPYYQAYYRNTYMRTYQMSFVIPLVLSASDYIELYMKVVIPSGNANIGLNSWWGGHKLIGV
jgi:hypothetical protein